MKVNQDLQVSRDPNLRISMVRTHLLDMIVVHLLSSHISSNSHITKCLSLIPILKWVVFPLNPWWAPVCLTLISVWIIYHLKRIILDLTHFRKSLKIIFCSHSWVISSLSISLGLVSVFLKGIMISLKICRHSIWTLI